MDEGRRSSMRPPPLSVHPSGASSDGQRPSPLPSCGNAPADLLPDLLTGADLSGLTPNPRSFRSSTSISGARGARTPDLRLAKTERDPGGPRSAAEFLGFGRDASRLAKAGSGPLCHKLWHTLLTLDPSPRTQVGTSP
jgi:hypothetical protein